MTDSSPDRDKTDIVYYDVHCYYCIIFFEGPDFLEKAVSCDWQDTVFAFLGHQFFQNFPGSFSSWPVQTG